LIGWMGNKGSSEKDDVIDGDPNVLGPHHFRIGRVLGRGAFGKVIAVTKKDTKKNYAVKLLSKHHIMEKNAVKSVLNERKLLADLSNPFIVNLLYAYQTEQDLCMVVDLMYGGDVRFHLTKETYFDEERVKFYAASVVLALEYLHGRRVCHRDIKPDNLLLDENGYCHLTDFNIAVQFSDERPTTSNFAGTKPYMAPEIWNKQPYSTEPDLFSLGATLYEMVAGRVPFHVEPYIQDPDSNILKKMILEDKVHFPKRLSRECMAFLYSLLEKTQQKRLKLPAVKQHPWFKGMEWEKISAKAAKPPFDPNKSKANVLGIHDLQDQLAEKPKLRPLTEDEQKSFAEWDWIRSGVFEVPAAGSAGAMGRSNSSGSIGREPGDSPPTSAAASSSSSPATSAKQQKNRESKDGK